VSAVRPLTRVRGQRDRHHRRHGRRISAVSAGQPIAGKPAAATAWSWLGIPSNLARRSVSTGISRHR